MRWSRLFRSAVALAVATVALSPVPAAQAGRFVPEQGSDFDCDGLRDSVHASPGDFVDGIIGAGSVTVRYADGVVQRITQSTPGVAGVPESGDLFGWRHTTYDRNADGCDDLVVGVPAEDIGAADGAGLVTIVPGSPTGLDPTASVTYTQDSPGVPGVVEAGDTFGNALAAGETHLGEPFLLIGSPGESGPGRYTGQAGAIHYLRGGSMVIIHADSPGVPGRREASDHFGAALATSDRYFAVGIPGESVAKIGAGMVQVFSHTLTDGRPTAVASFRQDTPGISGVEERGDRFGTALSVLSYRPSATAPVGALVAVGTPQEAVGTAVDAGMAHLVHVSPTGAVRQLAAITQTTPGVTGVPEAGDSVGWDVVLANLSPSGSVATPQTTAWAVAAGFEESTAPSNGGVHVFRPGWRSGDPNVWLTEGRFGMGPRNNDLQLRASASHLHAGGDSCYAIPWANLLNAANEPAIERPDDCR